MNRRFIAATLLGVLLVLSGIDFLEDTGLVQYFSSDVDRSLDDALSRYGEAIRSGENALMSSLELDPYVFYCCRLNALEPAWRNILPVARRKRNLDFSESVFNPFEYSQIWLV